MSKMKDLKIRQIFRMCEFLAHYKKILLNDKDSNSYCYSDKEKAEIEMTSEEIDEIIEALKNIKV